MNGRPGRSLRTRILLLATLTCVFLAIAAGSLYSFIRSSHQTTVRDAERHLRFVATGFAAAYAGQVSQGVSLRNLPRPERPQGPPPPPPPEDEDRGRGSRAGERGRGGPLPPPPMPPPDPLSQLTASVLLKEDGIEGGFLAGDGPLVGYAFPTHEGPGGEKEMPQRERPTIEQLAHRAKGTGAAQSYTFEGSHDVTLFTALPVRERVAGASEVTGAVWLMQRLPEINRGRSRQLLVLSLGFLAAALVTALLAWFVTAEVSGGVSAVTRRLASLEHGLAQAGEGRERSQLLEFEGVLSGINAMAASLERRIANERYLEQQLRHRERLSSLGQFAAGVAHELRNPLATIRLRAQMSEHGAAADGSVARNSGVILEEVDRLDAMIGRLLLFARPISLDRQTLEVRALCEAVVQAWAGRAPETVRLRCEVPDGIAVVADRSRLLQVLDNLVENAIQAMRGVEGEVVLRASEGEEMIEISVMDGGSGFTRGALQHAFDPFYTTKETGTGLGLSIAFELVEAHGGELRASSRPEGGATVSILLPRRTRREGAGA